MFRNGKYRYTLEFSGETEQAIRVGRFLEACKNKKSRIVIPAIDAYLTAHPDLLSPRMEIVLSHDNGLSKGEILKLIEAEIAKVASSQEFESRVQVAPDIILESELDTMLDDLDAFENK